MLYDDDIMLFDLKVVKLCDSIWIFDYTDNSVGYNNEKLEALKNELEVRTFSCEEYYKLLKGDGLY
jgi:diphthamide biosynthesis methyltransferase